MSVITALLVTFLLSRNVVAAAEEQNEAFCPRTIVDCACTEKDGNFYTIQINTTTVYISDEDIGMDRCIADQDPLALCEERNCVIIPNENFANLFLKGRKMSPSNYLQEDMVAENEFSNRTLNNTDQNPGPGSSEDETALFYPIELTYPRMIHGEESGQLVKRDIQDDTDSFIPPPASEFGDEEYRQKGHDSFMPHPDSDYGKRDHPDSFRRPSNSELRDDEYRKQNPDSYRRVPDSELRYEQYGRQGSDSVRPPLGSELRDEEYREKSPDAFRRLSPDSRLRDDGYGRKDSGAFRPPSNTDFGNEKYGQRNPEGYRPSQYNDFGEGRGLQNDSNAAFLSHNNDAPPIMLSHLEEHTYFRGPNGSDQNPRDLMASASKLAGPTIINPLASGTGESDPSPDGAAMYWGTNYGYSCRIPQLRNSEVTCWKWPNWQTCKQTCIYGHGIASNTGTLRSATYTCRNSENKWKPHRLIDCQPYLNCKVRLRSPGDLKCVEPTNQPAYCDITCEEYEDHSAQKVRVTCDEQKGGMRLPFCATLDNSYSSHIRSPGTQNAP